MELNNFVALTVWPELLRCILCKIYILKIGLWRPCRGMAGSRRESLARKVADSKCNYENLV